MKNKYSTVHNVYTIVHTCSLLTYDSVQGNYILFLFFSLFVMYCRIFVFVFIVVILYYRISLLYMLYNILVTQDLVIDISWIILYVSVCLELCCVWRISFSVSLTEQQCQWYKWVLITWYVANHSDMTNVFEQWLDYNYQIKRLCSQKYFIQRQSRGSLLGYIACLTGNKRTLLTATDD